MSATDTSAPTVPDTGTGTPTPTPIDCSLLPVPKTPVKLAVGPSEDFTFGVDGLVYGVRLQDLMRTALDGSAELLAPNISYWGRGTRFLPDGDVVVAEPSTGSLLRFDPTTWGRETVVSNVQNPNGIAIDDRGFVFLTQLTGKVARIDPDTGESAVLYDTPVSTDGITFAPDYRTLYWNSEEGQILRAVLDDDGNIIDGPTLFADIDAGALLDGMTTDACGNLYVVDMAGPIHLVTPDGAQSQLFDLSAEEGGDFISAVNFGNGYGGFETDRLYVMSLDSGLFEIEVGVEGKWEPHLP